MPQEKQYFDRVEIDDGYIWVVDEVAGIKAPVLVSAVSWSRSSSCSSEVVIQQINSPWWYSRLKYSHRSEIDGVVAQISDLINRLNRDRYK